MKKFEKPRMVGNRFCSYSKESIVGFFIRSLIMMIKSWRVRKKIKKSDIQCWSCKSEPLACSIAPKITWIGHATFLIQIGGVNILTDPVLGEVSYLYPRFLDAGINADKLPNIDFVLLSHNHPDHMDGPSLIYLKKHKGTSFLVPLKDKLWFDAHNFSRVKECTWWEQSSFDLRSDSSKQVKFTFLPSNHWSLSGFFNKNVSLWGSWMIECNGYTIYFAGDTSYDSHFKEISQKFKNIDVALMPIGPCEPKAWVEHSHMDALQAGQAFVDLNAKHFVPMHWGTFSLGTEMFDTPIVRLNNWWSANKQNLKDKKLHLSKFGESISL